MKVVKKIFQAGLTIGIYISCFTKLFYKYWSLQKVGDLQNELRSYLDMSSHVYNFPQELKLGVRNS